MKKSYIKPEAVEIIIEVPLLFDTSSFPIGEETVDDPEEVQ